LRRWFAAGRGVSEMSGLSKALVGVGSREMRLISTFLVLVFCLSVLGFPAQPALAQEFVASGSLPEVAKKINQLIYPTLGNPAITTRGGDLTIEWDWRLSDAAIPLSALPVGGISAWSVYLTTSVAANVQHYNGNTNDPAQWYRYRNSSDPFGYGTYDKPVNTVVNTRRLRVKKVTRGPSTRWPEVFGQTGYTVDRITVSVPGTVPLDLYDLHVEFKGTIPAGYPGLIPPGHETTLRSDLQPHALQVIKSYSSDMKIVQITDTHVFGQEIQNALGIEFNSFELREPRPGTPSRKLDPVSRALLKYDDFPYDKDLDGKANEGAIYLQEELQAINLIDPDFVVFTGDSTFAQKNWNTYPKNAWPYAGTTGDVGSEYRFEYPWWYDELLALNVPVFCVPGNHDGYCWDGHQAEGGLEHDDGLEIWQDLFGPVYRSWDYGNYHFLGINTMDWAKKDADGPDPFPLFPDYHDRNGMNFFGYITMPNKWLGQLRGNGDKWGVGVPPAGSDLRWDPGDPSSYNGQLGWIKWDLETNKSKQLRGVFMHHDPLYPVGADPEMWANNPQFGLEMPDGEGEGSQSLVYLMRSNNVAFEASGHAHSDWVGQVPWYDGTGSLTALNTTSCEIPVGPETLISPTAEEYAGFRMLGISGGKLVGWGLAGANSDPMTKWSIPGWQGLGVGTATPANPAPNGFEIYRTNRPSIQWMEQDQAAPTPGASRPPILNGEGTFTTPSLGSAVALPLNDRSIGGPFRDVTCKVKNTLDGSTGATLTLTGCRIEFPMKRLSWGWHYEVQNGTITEQYNTDSGERMVVVSADIAPGVVPVRVFATR
jgi:Calcineurin-like phosphoesterase